MSPHRKAEEEGYGKYFTPEGSAESGWKVLPELKHIDGVKNVSHFVVDDSRQSTIPAYASPYDRNVKRAVIIVPGYNRDSWEHFVVRYEALLKAEDAFSDVKKSEIALVAPCFLADRDIEQGILESSQKCHGDFHELAKRVGDKLKIHKKASDNKSDDANNHKASNTETVYWKASTWFIGGANEGPADRSKSISSFDALDSFVDLFLDKKKFPHLETLVVAGHSAGAQMIQRYATLRKWNDQDDKLLFWIANPSTLVWPNGERPGAPQGFKTEHPEYNEYKYGLEKLVKYAKGSTPEQIVEHFRQRFVHYSWGADDHSPGSDSRWGAKLQGATRWDRGRHFRITLREMPGGWPSSHSVAIVPNVGHSGPEMLALKENLDKVFRSMGSHDCKDNLAEEDKKAQMEYESKSHDWRK